MPYIRAKEQDKQGQAFWGLVCARACVSLDIHFLTYSAAEFQKRKKEPGVNLSRFSHAGS